MSHLVGVLPQGDLGFTACSHVIGETPTNRAAFIIITLLVIWTAFNPKFSSECAKIGDGGGYFRTRQAQEDVKFLIDIMV